MANPSLAELQEQERALADALARVGAGLKRAKAAEVAAAKVWRLTQRMRRASVAMLVLSNGSAEPAVKYLATCARAQGWPEKDPEELAELAQDLFLQADVAEVAALADTSEPTDAAALAVALKYVGEWKVVVSMRHANMTSSAAPSSQAMVDEFERQRLLVPEGARPRSLGNAGAPRAKTWAHRLRKRWGGRFGAVSVADRLEPGLLRAKAGLFLLFGHVFLDVATENSYPVVQNPNPKSGAPVYSRLILSGSRDGCRPGPAGEPKNKLNFVRVF